MPKIVSVIPSSQYFSLTWRLGTRCNYDCMYCPTKWHDNHSKPHSFDTLKNVWIDLHNKSKHLGLKYKISFTGGEVTSSRSFLPFLRWLREHYPNEIHQILLTTNGSATTRYYIKLLEYVDNISFSMHSEHIIESEFFQMLREVKTSIPTTKFMHVNIMNEFWNQDRIVQYKNILAECGISHNVNEVNYSYQTRVYPIFKGKLNLEFH